MLVEADVGGADEHRGDARLIASLRECRDAIAAGKPLPALPARPGRPARACAQQFFRGLPEAMWSPELNAKLLELAQTKVVMYDAYISEMEQMPEDEAYLQGHSRSLGSLPIRVLSTGNHGIHVLDPTRPQNAEQQKYEQGVARAQAKWLELSSNAKQLFTDKSSEYIPFDQPSFVVDAIREVFTQRHWSGWNDRLPIRSPRLTRCARFAIARSNPDNAPMSLVTLLNAHIAFGERPLLDGAQLTVQAGERLGLIGRNGTGKSTLLGVLAGKHPAR